VDDYGGQIPRRFGWLRDFGQMPSEKTETSE